jgi:hypothetical protein
VQARRTQPLLLILVLLVHVLALWLLARQHGVRPPTPADKEQRITWLLPVVPPRFQPPPPVARQRAAPAAPPVQAVAAANTSPTPGAASPALASEPAPVQEPHRLSGAEILEQARADMPRLERELRNNVPTKLKLQADSFRYKLEHGIADAYVGGDQRVTVDFYTSPDNVHYMRMTKGGKSWCTMNGGPVTLARANGIGVDRDTKVNCPPASPMEWKDMPYLN